MSIGEDDSFIVYNGRDQSAPMISSFADEHDDAFYVSMTTQQYAFVRFETEDYTVGKHGVIFKYFQGIFVSLVFNNVFII